MELLWIIDKGTSDSFLEKKNSWKNLRGEIYFYVYKQKHLMEFQEITEASIS